MLIQLELKPTKESYVADNNCIINLFKLYRYAV